MPSEHVFTSTQSKACIQTGVRTRTDQNLAHMSTENTQTCTTTDPQVCLADSLELAVDEICFGFLEVRTYHSSQTCSTRRKFLPLLPTSITGETFSVLYCTLCAVKYICVNQIPTSQVTHADTIDVCFEKSPAESQEPSVPATTKQGPSLQGQPSENEAPPSTIATHCKHRGTFERETLTSKTHSSSLLLLLELEL